MPDKKTGFARKTLVIRYTERKGRGTSPRVIKKFDNTYSLVFGRDGMLYVPNGFLGTHRPKRLIRSMTCGQDPACHSDRLGAGGQPAAAIRPCGDGSSCATTTSRGWWRSASGAPTRVGGSP